MKILAIETSCDETAAAVIESSRLPLTAYRSKENYNNSLKADDGQRIAECHILSNVVSSQIDIHKKFGGIFPEHASRAHTEKIISVVEQALACNIFDAIAVTVGPGLIGSLLVGVNFAKTLAYVMGKPIIGINHWLGHIYSCFTEKTVINSDSVVIHSDSLSNNKSQSITRQSRQSPNHTLPQFPALILIASGGHTGLVLMKSHNDIRTLGETLDDAAGEAFDKVAKLLGLGYPGGPAISKAATKAEGSPRASGLDRVPEASGTTRGLNIKFPRSMLDRKDYNFSFSGLKTAVLYKVRELELQGITIKSCGKAANHYKSLIAYEFQQAVIDILIGKTLQAAHEFRPKSICLCGGVSANRELRQQMAQRITQSLSITAPPQRGQITFHVPPLELTTDNAAMIGLAAAYQEKSKWTTYDKINANANLRL